MDANLDEALSRWLDNHFVDPEQATRIREYENARTDNAWTNKASPSDRPITKIPLAVEAAGYVGGALAIAALIAIASTFWDQLSTASRVGLFGTVSVVLFLGGWTVGKDAPAAALRMRSALWAFSICGLVGAVATLTVDGIGSTSSSDNALITSLAAAVYACVLWSVSRSRLQRIILYASLVAMTVSLVSEATDISASWYSLALWILGVIWLLFAWTQAERDGVDYVLGATTVILGVEPSALDKPALGITWGLLSIAAAIALGIRLKQSTLVVMGTLGLLLFVPQACAHWLGGSIGAAMGLLVVGFVILGLAIARLRSRSGR